MRLTNSRPLVSPPLPEREADPRAALEAQVAAKDANGQFDELGVVPPPSFSEDVASATSMSSDLNWTMPRTGLNLPSLPETSDITEYLLKKVLTADDIKAPRQLLHRMSTSSAQVAELMWALRPLVYALLMQRWQSLSADKRQGRSAWTPWLVGVGIEIVARQLAKRDFKERLAGGLRGLTRLEREELKNRDWAMGWWALRGAFYENVTRQVGFCILPLRCTLAN